MMTPKQTSKSSIAPSIQPEKAIPLMRRQIERLDQIEKLQFDDPGIEAWVSTTVAVLNGVFGQPNGESDRRTRDLEFADGGDMFVGMSDEEVQASHTIRCKNRKALLEAYLEQLEDMSGSVRMSESQGTSFKDPLSHLHNILNRFHIIARQLRNRHEGRSTILIEDEYDVQDLLHALLKADFDDIRPEEYTPSYAGSSARMDFLLKDEKIVIEVKKTRKGLEGKEIGNELLEDIGRYRSHHDCDTLICFIYDSEGRIGNPSGLKRDLEKLTSTELTVRVIINPV